ncbi:hypothetical protein B0H13DRAFT_2352691 [Mycena leptocephala]|nr:hypothetical protein B0H13DRAFT_2352691 [Mycena leptocephala]
MGHLFLAASLIWRIISTLLAGVTIVAKAANIISWLDYKAVEFTSALSATRISCVLSRKGGLSRRVLTYYVEQISTNGPDRIAVFESIFELEWRRSESYQPNIHASLLNLSISAFGDFGSPNQYNGFVPTVPYLSSMMNKAIEREEADADQHTACQSPENLCIDDSHKVLLRFANVNGVPIFGAMWTCMSSFYIRAQALTLTKGHEERLGPLMGIAASAKRYGYSDPAVVYSDDPMKDKAMLLAAFPSLAEKLTPMAAAHVNLIESALSSLIAPLDIDPRAHLCVSLDAEWNISRQVHRFQRLPTALLRLLISQQVFLIGSAIKGDLTRLKKQFPQLVDCSMNVIDLKQFAIRRGIIKKNSSGSLEKLAEKPRAYFQKRPLSERVKNGKQI